ncbi:hypothetical protein A2U01_0052787, partial [Trifolium medium]|nr:hypothetical protein [Trifolium medium]
IGGGGGDGGDDGDTVSAWAELRVVKKKMLRERMRMVRGTIYRKI